MAQAPEFKIYDRRGQYQAACKEPEAGAALMALYGDGSTIRIGHSPKTIVWREGAEEIPAAESWDIVADTVHTRAAELREGGTRKW